MFLRRQEIVRRQLRIAPLPREAKLEQTKLSVVGTIISPAKVECVASRIEQPRLVCGSFRSFRDNIDTVRVDAIILNIGGLKW